MTWFECPFLGVPVELTEEREHHIAEEHPELLPEHLEDLRGTLATPDITFVRRDGPPSRLFAKWIAGGRRGRYLVAIVVTTPLDSGAPRHWIVTSYFARRIGVREWIPD